MDESAKSSQKKLWYYPLRGGIAFFILFALKSIVTRRLSGFIEDRDLLPSQLFYGIALIGIILIYNSLLHTFLFYDKDLFKSFRKRSLDRVCFVQELKIILKSGFFWLETLPAVILSALFSLLGGFYEAVYTVFFVGQTPAWAFKLIPLVLIPIVLFLTSLLCHYEIHRYWVELHKEGEENRVDSKAKFVIKLLIIFAMYPLVFPYTPYLLFVIINFFSIVGALISILSLLGFVACVCGITFAVIGLQRWKVCRLRRGFICKLEVLAKKKGESLVLLSKEEREVRGYDFTLSSAGKVYTCKIIPAMTRFIPLYFTKGDAYFLYRLGTKEHHTSIEKHFEYEFVSEGQKLIVLIKFPKRVFAFEYGATRKLYSGDKIWNYILFDDKSFLGAADRECLYRSNQDNR